MPLPEHLHVLGTDATKKADGVLFVTPENNYSVPGQLKNAIDWASRGGLHSPLRGWVRALSVR